MSTRTNPANFFPAPDVQFPETAQAFTPDDVRTPPRRRDRDYVDQPSLPADFYSARRRFVNSQPQIENIAAARGSGIVKKAKHLGMKATALVASAGIAFGATSVGEQVLSGDKEPSLADLPTKTFVIPEGQGDKLTSAIEAVNPEFEDRVGPELNEFNEVVQHVQGEDGMVHAGEEVEIPIIPDKQAGAE